MNPPILRHLTPKILIGKKLEMSYVNNRTGELWRSFMPRRKEITNNIGLELYSIQIYKSIFDFRVFNPSDIFTKWAAVEVTDFEKIPEIWKVIRSKVDFMQYLFIVALPVHLCLLFSTFFQNGYQTRNMKLTTENILNF